MPRTLAIQIQQPSGAVRFMFLKLNSESYISTFVGTATPSSPPWTSQANLVVKDGIDAVHKSDLNHRERPMHPYLHPSFSWFAASLTLHRTKALHWTLAKVPKRSLIMMLYNLYMPRVSSSQT